MLIRSILAAAPSEAAPPDSEAAPDRFRQAARAIGELRRGAAVIARAGEDGLAVAAVETVDAAWLAMLRDWAGAAPPFLLRPDPEGPSGRLAMPGHWRDAAELVTRALTRAEITPAALRLLADPMEAWTEDRGAVPAGAAGAVALAKLARLLPTLVAARVDGAAMARAAAAGIVIADAADILALHAAGSHLARVGEALVPLREAADARVVAFRNPESGIEHIAVVIGRPEEDAPEDRPAPLVRLHSECFTGDVLGSLRCDCGPQLHAALRRMAEEGAGVMLYLAQEGRGIGLLNKLRSYVLQDAGLDTLDANAALGFAGDERDFAIAAAMLRDLGVRRARLLTNNPAKLAALAAAGIAVERASLLIAANGTNDAYLATKAARFGHWLD